MLWHAMAPELNTAQLMAGAGIAPMMQAAAGWEALGTALDAHADDLAADLVCLEGMWTGTSSDHAIAATAPMVAWLRRSAELAHQRAQQATAQATSYTKALGTTPSLPEIFTNRITETVLEVTNFFGINTVPIGFTETDYFVRMWNQAATTMDVYQAETAVNTIFEPLEPISLIVVPGQCETVKAQLADTLAQMACQTAPDFSSDGSALTHDPAHAYGATEQPDHPDQPISRLLNQLSQLGTLMQPLLTSLLSQTHAMGDTLDTAAEIGLVGTSPLSNHPLTGGSGPSKGAGLIRASSLPGAGGTPPRTQLLAGLLNQPPASAPTTLTPNAGPSPVDGAAGPRSWEAGGPVPLGAMSTSTQSASAKQEPAGAVPLTDDPDHDPEDHPPAPVPLTHIPHKLDFEDVDHRGDWDDW